jgi:hypothetical protein
VPKRPPVFVKKPAIGWRRCSRLRLRATEKLRKRYFALPLQNARK